MTTLTEYEQIQDGLCRHNPGTPGTFSYKLCTRPKGHEGRSHDYHVTPEILNLIKERDAAEAARPRLKKKPLFAQVTEDDVVTEIPIKSGSKTFKLLVGAPCKVKGLGRGGKIGTGYTIDRFVPTDSGLQVEVSRADRSLTTVPLADVVYMHPGKTLTSA